MSIWWVLTIISILLCVGFLVWCILDRWYRMFPIVMLIIFIFCLITFIIPSIAQPLSIKKEMIRQNKERQQILYQIEHLTEESDRVKLNEWILTYNDWVNDVNTSKELYGWFSWYHNVDMSNHTIIELV